MWNAYCMEYKSVGRDPKNARLLDGDDQRLAEREGLMDEHNEPTIGEIRHYAENLRSERKSEVLNGMAWIEVEYQTIRDQLEDDIYRIIFSYLSSSDYELRRTAIDCIEEITEIDSEKQVMFIDWGIIDLMSGDENLVSVVSSFCYENYDCLIEHGILDFIRDKLEHPDNTLEEIILFLGRVARKAEYSQVSGLFEILKRYIDNQDCLSPIVFAVSQITDRGKEFFSLAVTFHIPELAVGYEEPDIAYQLLLIIKDYKRMGFTAILRDLDCFDYAFSVLEKNEDAKLRMLAISIMKMMVNQLVVIDKLTADYLIHAYRDMYSFNEREHMINLLCKVTCSNTIRDNYIRDSPYILEILIEGWSSFNDRTRNKILHAIFAVLCARTGDPECIDFINSHYTFVDELVDDGVYSSDLSTSTISKMILEIINQKPNPDVMI